jgi:hypothetical protein
MHGNALNITCVSYAGTLNFGLTGARDTLPHLQRLAIYMGEALAEIERLLLGKGEDKRKAKHRTKGSDGGTRNGKPSGKRASERSKRGAQTRPRAERR